MSEEAISGEAAVEAPPAAPAKKGGGAGGVLAIVLPAIVAGGAAFGAVKFSAPHGQAAPHEVKEMHPPGPTLQLEPFLITVQDGNKHTHPMKVSLAVELEHGAKDEALKAFAPRIRDACLSYIRTLTYEQAVDQERLEKVRADLVKRLKEDAGVEQVSRVLITDFVVQ